VLLHLGLRAKNARSRATSVGRRVGIRTRPPSLNEPPSPVPRTAPAEPTCILRLRAGSGFFSDVWPRPLVEPAGAPDLTLQLECLLELGFDLRPRLRSPSSVRHRAQDAVDAEPGCQRRASASLIFAKARAGSWPLRLRELLLHARLQLRKPVGATGGAPHPSTVGLDPVDLPMLDRPSAAPFPRRRARSRPRSRARSEARAARDRLRASSTRRSRAPP
jgi:hypothetical protein